MNHAVLTQHADLSTALSLIGYDECQPTRLRDARQLARECTHLDIALAGAGINYADADIAGQCAEALEHLAERFRRVEDHLGGAQ